jgi:3-oxoacyl-[acyl-carrier protein] reductase
VTARRAALVTGAASGLARGVAYDLARAGYRVAITYRPGGTPPEATLALIASANGQSFAVAADHAVEGETERSVREIEAEFGTLDVLVHMVGPMLVRSFARSSLADYASMLDANLRSAVEAAFAVLPGMRARGYGRLVFFGMNGSRDTLPGRGLSFYAAAKAGLTAFARVLSLEEAKAGITVNLVEPGDIRDKNAGRAAAKESAARNPTGHAGSWEDVAYAVRFLIAEEAGFINGQTIAVNGGLVEPHE